MAGVVPEAFQLTFGCQLIAYFLDSVLYGVAMVLVVLYFRAFKDGPKMSVFVSSLVVLATLHITLFTYLVYEQMILHFGDLPGIDIMPREAVTQLLAIYVTAFVCQMYFVTRIWTISRGNIWIVTPIVLLALLQVGAGIAQTTLSAIVGRFSLLGSTTKVTTLQSGATAACDVSITLALCYVLQKSRTGFKRTDGLLTNLIIFTVNRGAITSFAALMNMVWFVARPGTFIFMVPLEPSCELYVISVIATLLARSAFRADLTRTEAHVIPLSNVSDTVAVTGSGKGCDVESGVHISTSVMRWDSDKEAMGRPDSDKDSSKMYE